MLLDEDEDDEENFCFIDFSTAHLGRHHRQDHMLGLSGKAIELTLPLLREDPTAVGALDPSQAAMQVPAEEAVCF